MKFILPFLLLITGSLMSAGQVVTRKLVFDQGRILSVRMEMKSTIAQQVMGRAIDFHIDAQAAETYKVTNATGENTTLHHELKRIKFNFDGMGFNRSFDTDNAGDMAGHIGKPMQELLEKTYDMVIDTAGTVLMTQPEKIELPVMDERFAMISNMLKDVFGVVKPPARSGPSFFHILPAGELKLNSTWSDSSENANGRFHNNYTITSITDSTIIIGYTGKSVTVTNAQMMGNTTHTTMNNKSTGTIILDRLTGIMREKSITIESNGTTEIMDNSVPVTSNASIIIKVE